MKPFIGIDITENKNNTEFNGREFVVQTTSPVMFDAYNNATEDVGEMQKKAFLPLPFKIIHTIVGVAAVIIASSFVKAVLKNDGLTFWEAYNNVPWLFWVGIFCWALFGIITIVSRKKNKRNGR